MLTEEQKRWIESVESGKEFIAKLQQLKKAGRISVPDLFQAQKYWAGYWKEQSRKSRLNPNLWQEAVEVFGEPVDNPVDNSVAPEKPDLRSWDAFKARALEAERQEKAAKEAAKKKKRL